MSDAGTSDGNQNENASAPKQQESLEDLLTTLNKQITSSGWLQQNTAEKFEADNPEVAKVFKELAEAKKGKDEDNTDKS